MLFPKPFAKSPQSNLPQKFTRQETSELRQLTRAERLEAMLHQEQAEMRKEAERVPGEWISTLSGVALFLPTHTTVRAKAMQEVDVGALERAS